MTDQGIYEPIPQPPGYPVLGNLFDLRGAETPIQALMKLARQYGPIFRLHVGPRRFTVVSGFDLVDELCDEERFDPLLPAQQSRRPRQGLRRGRPGPRRRPVFPADQRPGEPP
jgi:cytochrome P450/NADPH-cytochrome P450 reductase